jgi:hypothetical protein
MKLDLPGRMRTCRTKAFTLLEVMIALAVFFIAVFAILELTSRNLKMARALQQKFVDPAILASELSITNQLTEGIESGDFGDLYAHASWERSTLLVSTNGLYQVDIMVFERSPSGALRTNGMSILLYRPLSVTAAGGGSTRLRAR